MIAKVLRDHEALGLTGRLRIRASRGETVKLIAMGDLDFHDPIAGALREKNPSYLFDKVVKSLATADLRLANLETVVVRQPRDLLKGRACLVAPLDALDALHSANIDVVTFANNHVLDMGAQGMLECLEHLRAASIEVAGAGPNLSAARRPAMVERKGIQFIIFGYSYGCGQIAGKTTPGCAEAKLDSIIKDLAKWETSNGVKIVCLHMDAEFQSAPSPDRIVMCRRLADAGVDIVLCHHPHVAQGIERWGRSLIAYSLGNYVTPVSGYMLAHSMECHLSFHLEVECDADGVAAAEIVPVVIDESGRPNLADREERSVILDLIADRSNLLADNDRLRELYQRMVAKWSVGVAELFYWSLGKRDWFTCRRLLEDLWQTPTKRRWLVDFLAWWSRRMWR